MEALKNNTSIHKLIVAKGAAKGSIVEILARAKERKIPIQEVEKNYLDTLADNLNHQGVAAVIPERDYAEVEDIIARASDKGEDLFVLVLDEIEDPHNLGAILRISDAVGVHGVIIPKRRAVGLTPAVARASAGAVEYVPVARVSNLAQTIDKLKEAGCWVVGADMDGEQMWDNKGLKGPLACVIGSEGKGIGRLLKEKCDFMIRIPMKGGVSSLNASVATAVLCYEILRQREAVK